MTSAPAPSARSSRARSIHARLGRDGLAWGLRTVVLASGLVLSGCGGSGASPVTIALLSVAAVDGQTNSSGPVAPTAALLLGDSNDNSSYRGHLRFDTSSLPAGATILSAVLRVCQYTTAGAPYNSLGNVLVDHVNLGAGLDAADHLSVPLSASFGTLSTGPVNEFKTLQVTVQVSADRLAGRTNSDFRLHFTIPSDMDGVVEWALFNDAENNGGNGKVPELVVTYQP